ncbi:MAG TPA: hypothetical protein VFG91_07730 [Woeseiaceae bacterium]|nr:hypothetical protein [Woeseiaceae bacterium]
MTEPRAGSRGWWTGLLRDAFGPTFWVFAAVAAVLAAATYTILGRDSFEIAMSGDLEILAGMLPRIVAAQIVAGLVWVLMPRDRVTRLLGTHRGRRGLMIATAAGIVTPGGPVSAFSFLAVMAGAGADGGILVAYITSWALLGMQRIVVWDVPFMGADFSALRFCVCLPLPLIAGWIARRCRYTHAAVGLANRADGST